jgi:hypothetical protein
LACKHTSHTPHLEGSRVSLHQVLHRPSLGTPAPAAAAASATALLLLLLLFEVGCDDSHIRLQLSCFFQAVSTTAIA